MDTVPTSEELVASFHEGTLALEMARRFGLTDKANLEVVEGRCAALHNAGTIDLLQLIEGDSLLGLEGHHFFSASNFYCHIIPELETTPARMMACINALVARGGKDLAANQPNAAFRAWCEKMPERACSVIAAARAGDQLAVHHLTFALEATKAFAEAREIALEYCDERRLSAITALGRIDDKDDASRAATLAVFSELTESKPDDKQRAMMLNATAAILERGTDVAPSEAIALITRLVEGAGTFTMQQSAYILSAYPKALIPEIVECLLKGLAHLQPASEAVINDLDLGLQSLLEHGYDDAPINYVTDLLSREDNHLQLDELQSFMNTLLSGPKERLSRAVVKWLLLGTRSLCNGLLNSLKTGGMAGPVLEIRSGDLAITSAAQIFLCRKAIGWFFFKPITAASIVVSVLRVCEEETAVQVQKLLTDPLLINYVGVRDYLGNLTAEDAAKSRVDNCLTENDRYLAAIQDLPLIKELGPSEHKRSIQRLRTFDQMRDAQKAAESQSPLLSMIKRSVLLYGNRSLSFLNDGSDTLRPFEMDLKPYSISFEMPRMDIVDPVGLDYTIRVFRGERLSS
ncbi:hypothetical protein E4633_03735 [Geomonas terrae]|uniref:Uncharacterized protein n=1 Tax=Geomonas terrae TaxID=2562681 RepID=A0A4S1CMV1_9BACT|nr:hypothetical protein [Geomonas terrae]TGU74586.1 hypothetical protein E4633_03735 [Geomonas terrae]